jgi:transposase-like protein
MTKYEATAEQWSALYEDAFHCDATSSCLLELRSRVEALEAKYETQRLATLEWGKDVDKVKRWSDRHLQRIEALEATQHAHAVAQPGNVQFLEVKTAYCPHVATSDEGTSYCTLAEQTAKPSSNSLVKRVAATLVNGQACDHDEARTARAAIREVAAWLTSNPDVCFPPALVFALEQEGER